MPPFFASFDDAWRWFTAGGELTPMAEWRQRFTAGRGQLLSFQVPVGDTAIADVIEDLQSELGDIDGIAIFEPEMLHISVRGVGFQVIAKATRRRHRAKRSDASRSRQRASSAPRSRSPSMSAP